MISLRRQVMRQYSQYIFRMQEYTTIASKKVETSIFKRATTPPLQKKTITKLQDEQPGRRQSVETVLKTKNNNNTVQQQQQQQALLLKQQKKEQRALEEKKKAEKVNSFKTYLSELPVLQYPNHYKVKCLATHEDTNKCITQLLSKDKVFGLDLEWPPVFVKGQSENKISLVQICSDNVIVLIQLSRTKGVPSELRKFFERKDILKSGVNIRQDGLKIYRDYGIITNGLVELTDMAEDSKSSKLENVHLRSLRALTGLFMEQSMPKGKVRISNWASTYLSSSQVKYAANDAYASYRLFRILEELIKTPIRVTHLIDENITSSTPKKSSPPPHSASASPSIQENKTTTSTATTAVTIQKQQKQQQQQQQQQPRRNSNTILPTSTTEVIKKRAS